MKRFPSLEGAYVGLNVFTGGYVLLVLAFLVFLLITLTGCIGARIDTNLPLMNGSLVTVTNGTEYGGEVLLDDGLMEHIDGQPPSGGIVKLAPGEWTRFWVKNWSNSPLETDLNFTVRDGSRIGTAHKEAWVYYRERHDYSWTIGPYEIHWSSEKRRNTDPPPKRRVAP